MSKSKNNGQFDIKPPMEQLIWAFYWNILFSSFLHCYKGVNGQVLHFDVFVWLYQALTHYDIMNFHQKGQKTDVAAILRDIMIGNTCTAYLYNGRSNYDISFLSISI